MKILPHPRGGLATLLLSTAFVAGIGVVTSAHAADQSVIAKELLAPSDSVSFRAEPSPIVNAPITGGTMSLPYAHVLPLPGGPIGDPKRTYTFCFSQALTGSTWAVAQQESVMLEAARHPNVKVFYHNTNNDPLKQVADLDTCMAQKVDAIIVWPHSVAPLTPEIDKLHDAGFVVVGLERTVNTHNYDSWVYLDYTAAMGDLASAVCKKLGGKGTVVETEGALGSSPQILRKVGFANGLKEKCPAVKIDYTAPTDYSRGQGYKVALDYLQGHRDQKIDLWFSHYTEIGFGVNQALKDYGRADIPHYSIVDGKVAVEAVQKGVFAALAPWSPLHGDLGLRAAIYKVTGRPVPKNILLVQPPLISEENAAEVLKTTWPG